MIPPGAPLDEVAARVGAALYRRGVRAVLVGGACVAVHTGGVATSKDIDLVVEGRPSQDEVDRAMTTIGFRRHHDRYVSDATDFYVEFPPGPLAVGASLANAVVYRSRFGPLRILSPTDICKDRLAAAHHWNDRQSLELAVLIAQRRRIDRRAIERWCRAEGADETCREFKRRLQSRLRPGR